MDSIIVRGGGLGNVKRCQALIFRIGETCSVAATGNSTSTGRLPAVKNAAKL
jgi:hypothetical protein